MSEDESEPAIGRSAPAARALNGDRGSSVKRVMRTRLGVAVVAMMGTLGAPPAWAQQPTPAPPSEDALDEAPPAPPPEATDTPREQQPAAPHGETAEAADAPTDSSPTEGDRPGAPTDAETPRPVPGGEPAQATSRRAAAERITDASVPDARPVIYTVEGVSVRGNTRTHSRVVLRYVPFGPGDILDVDDPEVELVRYRLLGTGFFRNVELSLERGTRPGQVVLVVTVEERNTVIVNDIWMGLAADANLRGEERPLVAYAGVDVAETNLAGTGITLGGAMGIAPDQLALRVRFLDPSFLGGPVMTSGTLLFNDARDFFGNDDVFFSDLDTSSEGLPSFAVAQYQRFGGSFGVGVDLAVPTQLWMSYRLETIRADLPAAASHVRGSRGELDREPIDFDVLPGRSVLATLSTTLQHDTRDRPVLTTRGWFAAITGEVSLAPLGSEYPYTRVDARMSKWWQLPWQHVVRLELFGGAISGNAPFFEQYYVGDLSDFRASRLLGLNVERRPTPNVFDTTIVETRYGDYAAKITGEYRLPLYRGSRSVYGIDLFGSMGLFGIASARDLSDPPGGYGGARRIPIDFTANLGFRMDTSVGGFTLAFANALGFLPPLNGNR